MTHEPPTGWDASAHPDLERLAELEEGLLDPADAAQVAEHVSGCERCHDQQAELEHSRSLLAALPAVSMPPDVVARLEAALADADANPGTSSQPTTVVPLNTARRRWRSRPTAAGLGAAAAVTALVVALVVGHTSSGSNGGSAGPQQPNSLAQGAASSVLSGLSTDTSGTNYTPHNLASAVPSLVSGPAAESTMKQAAPAPARPRTGAATTGGVGGAGVAGVPASLLRLHDSPSALQSCVLGVEAGGQIQRPLAIDFARYLGAPAVLIVLPGLNSGFLDAWFVGPGCDSTDVHLLGYKAIPSSASASPSPGG